MTPPSESTSDVSPRTELAGRRVAVIGMGCTGLATAEFMRDRGARVLLVDTRPAAELGPRLAAAERLGVELRVGCRRLPSADRFDLAVMSPGLSLEDEVIAEAARAGLPVVSEIEVASWFCSRPIVAVCGTNGKGTACTLLGDMLRLGGKRVVVAGNIGAPLIGELGRIQESDVVVAEVSSFQLEGIERFRPHIAVLLNITPDHLERHHTFAAYVAAKSRLF
ncbi:MAG: Mur ligase family protein, partial [Armatimonadota bacterium]